MKKYLLDTSVLLDLFLNRLPWAADMAVIWDAHRQGQIKALVAAFAVPTIFYIVRRQAGLTTAQTVAKDCLSTLDIAPIDQTTLLAAQALSGLDFEDDLQIACAVQARVDAIVTRDPRGFAASPIPIVRGGGQPTLPWPGSVIRPRRCVSNHENVNSSRQPVRAR